MSLTLAIQLLVLLAVANGTPVLATRLLGNRWARPLDGGRRLSDGRPLFGSSKTARGVVAALLTTAPAAEIVGLSWQLGALFAASSMAGDLFSSFIKRRLGIESSGQAVGLDQIPEALFPVLVCHHVFDLGWLDVVMIVALFTLGQLVISPLMYRLGIRKRPY